MQNPEGTPPEDVAKDAPTPSAPAEQSPELPPELFSEEAPPSVADLIKNAAQNVGDAEAQEPPPSEKQELPPPAGPSVRRAKISRPPSKTGGAVATSPAPTPTSQGKPSTPPQPIAPATPAVSAAAPSTPTTPQVTPPEAPQEAPVPETLEKQAQDRGTAFFYQIMTGEKKSAPEAQKQLESLGLFTIKEGTVSDSTKELVSRSARVEDAKLALLALVAESQKKENRENGVKKAHFESETRKARLELEHRLDEMKFAWMKQWEKDNRERNPNLTKAELHEESIAYSARVVFRAATNFYPKLANEESALIARTPAEKGLLQRYSDLRNTGPLWKRVAVSAAVAGGTTVALMTLFGTAGIPMIAGVAGWRSLRAATSAGIAGSITTGIEKFFGKRLDERGKRKRERALGEVQTKKEAVIDEQVAKFEATLRTELEGKPEWLADRAVALAIMKKVDTDAKTCADEREKIFSAQERAAELIGTKWRKRLAIGTGLAVGGGMALSAVDWERVPGWINGIRSSVIDYVSPAQSPGVGGTLDHARTTVLGWCPDVSHSVKLPDPYPICDPTETNVLTIRHGSSVWGTAQRFIGETVQGPDGPVKITKDMVRAALGNSTVEMVTEHGKHIQVPVLEAGLVHAGDQVALVHEGSGWKIWIGDYAKDHYHAGNNALFKQIHEANNLPVANWMREGTTPPARLVANTGNLLSRVCDTVTTHGGGSSASSTINTTAIDTGITLPPADTGGVSLAPKAWTDILPAPEPEPGMSMLPEHLYTPDGIAEIKKGFAEASLYDQEKTLTTLNLQITDLEQTMTTPLVGDTASAQLAEYHNELIALQHALITAPEHLSNVTGLGSALAAHDVSLDFYNRIENMEMNDFMKLSKNPAALRKSSVLFGKGLRIYAGDASRLHDAIASLGVPGKADMRMTVGNFMKQHASMLVVRQAA